MKKIILIPILFLFLCSCSNSDSSKNSPLVNSMKGKWQLVQNLYYDNEHPDDPHYVADGYTYTFSDNGTFIYNDIVNNTTSEGTYSISNDSIIEFITNPGQPNQSTYQKKITSINSPVLDLSNDLTGTMCTEGCGERFQKITEAPAQ